MLCSMIRLGPLYYCMKAQHPFHVLTFYYM